MDPFVLIDQSVAQGKLKQSLAAKIKNRTRYLSGAVARVEKASGISYPRYYVEPVLSLATTSIEFGSVGALYARVIPVNLEGRLSIIVQFTAPLVLFGLKGTIEAVAAHEFTHYVDLVRRLSKMQLSSDERASTLFEAGYADEERVIDPALVFAADKKLVSLIKKKFVAGLVDERLNEKVAKGWLEKGLPARRVSPEENVVGLSMESVAASTFDPMIVAKIAELEARKR